MSKKKPVNTGGKQENHFKPGQSGNPKGRPKGSLNKATILCQGIFADAAADIAEKAVDLALSGDTAMLKLLLDKTVPVRKDAPVHLDLPEIDSTSDLPLVTRAITKAVAGGIITPMESYSLTKILETHVKALEIAEIDARLRVLEGGENNSTITSLKTVRNGRQGFIPIQVGKGA